MSVVRFALLSVRVFLNGHSSDHRYQSVNSRLGHRLCLMLCARLSRTPARTSYHLVTPRLFLHVTLATLGRLCRTKLHLRWRKLLQPFLLQSIHSYTGMHTHMYVQNAFIYLYIPTLRWNNINSLYQRQIESHILSNHCAETKR